MHELSDADFDRLFPFHVWFEVDGSIRRLGSSLRKALGPDLERASWDELFDVRRPNRFRLEALSRERTFDRVVVLDARARELCLRGEITSLDGGETFVFLGSPWVRESKELGALGLRAGEFAKHDPTADLLTLMGTLQNSLRESRELGRELNERRRYVEQARREAEEANQAKSRFLAILSHEIRTPMNGLGSMVDMLRGTSLSPEQVSYADTIDTCAETLMLLLNDMLDVSKIEEGKLTLEELPFSPAEILRQSVDLYRLTAEAQSVRVACWIPPHLPQILIGDPKRLRQIVSNLLANAVKFTTRGEIALVVRAVRDVEGEVELDVFVQDTGPGVPLEARESIFAPFVQSTVPSGQAEDGGRPSGTGLGLTICRQLARLMDGEVVLENTGTRGSRFAFRARFRYGTAEGLSPAPRLLSHGPLSTRARESLQELGLRFGGEDAAAVVCQDASALAAATAGTGARLRGRPVLIASPNESFPAARSVDSQVRAHWVAESTGVLSPWIDALNEAFPCPSQRKRPQETVPSFAGRRILVAEDVPTNRLILERLLRRLDIEATFVSDGIEALEALEQGGFDLVLMDVEMPRMDGCEAVRRWRARESGGRLPILALTAHAMVDHGRIVAEAGMDDLVAKPVRLTTLAEALGLWLMPSGRAAAS